LPAAFNQRGSVERRPSPPVRRAVAEGVARIPEPDPRERRAELPRQVPVELPKPKESFDAELARIDDSIAGVLRQEGFKEALGLSRECPQTARRPEWTLAIDRRLGKTNDEIQALFASLQNKATDARRRGSESDVKAIVDQVVRWNLPDRAARCGSPWRRRSPLPPSSRAPTAWSASRRSTSRCGRRRAGTPGIW